MIEPGRLDPHLPPARVGTVIPLEVSLYRVRGKNRWHEVDIGAPSCTCRVFQRARPHAGIECSHLARLRQCLDEAKALAPDGRVLGRCTRCGAEIDITDIPFGHPNRGRCLDCRSTYERMLRESKRTGHPKADHQWFNTPKAMTPATTAELYWAAGFLEGEGCFSTNPKSGTAGKAVANQVNPEPLYRLQAIFGGRVRLIPRRRDAPKWQDQWQWSTSGARARGICMTLSLLMSQRRQSQIKASLGVI